MEYTYMYTNWMDRFESDETWLRSCEEFDRVSENRLMQSGYAKLVLTVCTHVPKHLQFAQINKKFKSDVRLLIF